jgi:hypothetical protein
MQQSLRTRTTIAVALIASAGLVAAGTTFTSSDAAQRRAIDANTLNGYHAKELVKTFYTRNGNSLDGFNSCTFRTKLTQPVRAPRAGFLQVTGSAGAARDTDNPDPAELVIQLLAGTKVISAPRGTQLTTDGSFDGNVSVDGYTRVPKGRTVLKLQLSECGDGDTAAFVTDRTISTLFVPFGTSKVARVLKAKAGVNR